MTVTDSTPSRNLPVVVARPAPLKSSRLGISARLGIAFFAVAVLAAAANLIGEVGSSIVYTKVEPAPRVIVAPPPPPPDVLQPEPEIVPPKALDAGALVVALDQFSRAAQERAAMSAGETIDGLTKATDRLMRASRAYDREAAGVIEATALKKVRTRVVALAKSGQELVRVADERRQVLKEYLARFETMDVRMKSSLERAFKIFGRVIARQSLIDLSASLDQMRHRLTAFASLDRYDRASVDAIAASETAFEARLQQSERSLVRSQGQEWVGRMRADFARIVALRKSLVKLAEQQAGDTDSFLRETGKVASAARATVALPQIAQAIAVAAQPVAPRPAPVAAAAEPVTVAPDVEAAAVIKLAEVKQNDTERKRRALVAWITAGVLVLVLITSIATVASIVGPVRRFMHATRRVANGQTHVRMPRGGLKELDLLGMAFNQMAEQLSAAQAVAKHYQETLEEKVAERTHQLQHLAEHDPLTQLPNRRQLFAFLNAAIERARTRGGLVGVLFLDVDNFKNINDSLGHAFGDRLLQGIAQRLRETAGASGFAARLGGDEFTVVLENAASTEQVLDTGEALLRAFQKPVPVDGRDLAISASVGVSLYPEHELDAEALLRAADAALFHAKALGRNQLTLFTRELVEAAASRFTIEQGLRRALERDEFELVFQPEIDLQTLEPVLVEALIRWRQPEGRLAMPAEFLTVAEESGLIMRISDWVLRASIEAAARWHHGEWPNVRVAINVSSRQLFDTQFVDRVLGLLDEYRVPPRCIEIELTETVLQTGATTIEALRRLAEHGVAIALDDFGTGYSSITSLEQLPLTRVKLDRSLIASIDTSARSAGIARSIIGLCNGLGLAVTAEGVERPAQLAILREHALYVQGYLLSHPVSGESLPAVLARLPAHAESLLLSLPADEIQRQGDREASPLRARSA